MSNKPTFDIHVNQNASFKMNFKLTDAEGDPLDISNWSFTGSIKVTHEEPDPPLLMFTSSVADPLDPELSTVSLRLSAIQTELLDQRRYVYDVIAVDPNGDVPNVYRILEGGVRVNPGVTDLDPQSPDQTEL